MLRCGNYCSATPCDRMHIEMGGGTANYVGLFKLIGPPAASTRRAVSRSHRVLCARGLDTARQGVGNVIVSQGVGYGDVRFRRAHSQIPKVAKLVEQFGVAEVRCEFFPALGGLGAPKGTVSSVAPETNDADHLQ